MRKKRLDSLARRTGRSRSFYVKAARREYLTDLEDAFAADIAIDVFQAGGRRSRPLSALEAETDRRPLEKPAVPSAVLDVLRVEG